ncbi:MAG: NAD-dependent epimerase/dehydratase family protein [Planctomycetes bacterium]|nr:NAD-dependent epimerase/dehydratase family protein [Planctomycetota bacterium]
MNRNNSVIVTGAAGLIGSETVRYFHQQEYNVIGIDNDMRKTFFGEEASTDWVRQKLEAELPGYQHLSMDIRDEDSVKKLFWENRNNIKLIVHCAAQPSHDWAGTNPFVDFSVNANGTLILLEMFRQHCPDAVFIYISTNKVYGDLPNSLPLVEKDTRWEVAGSHPYSENGIDETMSIDYCKHSLFGVSKAAADLMVQEYGRYFGLNTVCFRGGCLTGPGHSGTMLHGFLSFLVKCCLTGNKYTIFGYKGKQLRDNIHSYDLVRAFDLFFQNPRSGEIYNIGGSRHSNCSILEAMEIAEAITGKKMNCVYDDSNRSGDHIWWISDVRKFQSHYPEWNYEYDIERTIEEIIKGFKLRIQEKIAC